MHTLPFVGRSGGCVVHFPARYSGWLRTSGRLPLFRFWWHMCGGFDSLRFSLPGVVCIMRILTLVPSPLGAGGLVVLIGAMGVMGFGPLGCIGESQNIEGLSILKASPRPLITKRST